MERRESASGAFVRRTVSSGGRTFELLVLDAAADRPSGAPVVAAAAPGLDRDAAGRPALGLTLVLERAPGPGETVAPLVRSGLLGLVVTLAVPPWALDALGEDGPPPSPLFARTARFELCAPDGDAIAAAEGIGVGPRAALSAVLDARAALRALSALRGEGSGLEARATLTFRVPGSSDTRTLSISSSLDALLRAEPLELDRHVRLVAPRGAGAAPEELPPLAPAARPRAMPAGPALAAIGGRITSVAAALDPGEAVHAAPAQALAATQFGRIHATLLDDGRIALGGDARSMPLVQDPAGPLWPDRVDPRRRWYAPDLELVRPGANEDPSTSPFLFRFRQVGVTAGAAPAPGLEGTVTFTLRAIMPAAVREALRAAGDPPASPVPISALQVALEVPFREEGAGAIRTQLFPARVAPAGDRFAVTVDLLDRWVRLCYGALAYPGFQEEPAQLRLGWSFQAAVALPARPPQVIGAKLAATAISAGPIPGRIAFQPQGGVLHLPGADVKYAAQAARRGPPLPVARLVERRADPGARPLPARPRPARPPLVAAHVLVGPSIPRPEFVVPPELLDRIHEAGHAIRSVARGQALEALFPCRDFPVAYRRTGPDGADEAAGCQDALRLGEIEYRQLEELPELRRDDASGRLCTVYRSLQQPGRFLVAPARWRIARYGPAAGPDRAFRPTAMVYALRDEGTGTSRYLVSAQLEPDLPLHVRRELARRLAERTPSGRAPVIDYPTEPSLQATQQIRWAVPAPLGTPETTATWNGFQVTVSAALADALLLTEAIERSGLAGEVTFTLPDGLVLRAELRLDTAFTGPWATGPVEVTGLGNRATLANRVDVPVDVTELWVDGARGAPVVPVDRALEPGASIEVALPAAAADACAVATPRPGSPKLEETHLFVEDVTTNVVFVNLVSYANHGLSAMAMEVRLLGADHVYAVELAEGQHATLELELPLTSYVRAQTLELRLRVTPAQGEAAVSPWWSWDLEKQGNVVSVTPELLPAPPAARAAPPVGVEPVESRKPTVTGGPERARREERVMKNGATRSAGPRGMSIHIGLNHVDPGAYDGWDGKLAGCINDANEMEKIANAKGYERVTKLIDDQATSNAVLEAIGTAAQELEAGDHLLLTYSGHGGQVPDDTGEEDDGKNETWVLYDRQLIDNELYAMWGKFAAGVRILVVSDSCHSGTVVRMAQAKKEQKAVFEIRGKRAPVSAYRLMPAEKAEQNYRSDPRYKAIQWLTSGTRSRAADEVGASVLLLSGCQDWQFSQDGDANGLFTEKLLWVWQKGSGSFPGDYREFHQAICEEMPPEQRPNYFTTGAFDADFENSRPFEILSRRQVEPLPGPGDAPQPSITGPDSVTSDGSPPTFEIERGKYGYYAVEVATDPRYFVNGGGERTASNSYGSWSDVHRQERGTDPTFTLGAGAWQALRAAGKLYYRLYVTDQPAGAWPPFARVDGGAPLTIVPARAVAPPEPPDDLGLPPPPARAQGSQQQRRGA